MPTLVCTQTNVIAPRRWRGRKVPPNPSRKFRVMEHYVLMYHVVDNFVERRTPYREDHLRLVRDAHQHGDLLLAGALGDPVDRALLVFRADRGTVEAFARNDPYVRGGLVRRWEVQPWAVVVGPGGGGHEAPGRGSGRPSAGGLP